MASRIFLVLAAVSLGVVSLSLSAPTVQAQEIYTGESNVAINGYDVTSYFDKGEPIDGLPKYSIEYKGATWYFASKESMKKFEADPELYMPAYGGYCVWAISHGRLVAGLPHLWKIVDGKLYLLCTQDAMDQWLKDPQTHIDRANEKWPELKKQLQQEN